MGTKDLDIYSNLIPIFVDEVKLISLMPVVIQFKVDTKKIKNPIFVINDIQVPIEPKNIYLFDDSIRVVFPISSIPTPIKTVKLYAETNVLNPTSLILGINSSSYKKKIVNQLTKVFFSTPGTDIFMPIGGGLNNIKMYKSADAALIMRNLTALMPKIKDTFNSTADYADQLKELTVNKTVIDSTGTHIELECVAKLVNESSIAFTIGGPQ